MLGIGIDTGGTYTDTVIYDFENREVLAKGKALTTKENLEIGIMNALDSLPDQLIRKASILSLSTTLATNACVENKGGRAKLILLGTTRKVLEWIDAKTQYGLKEEDVLCVDSEEIYASHISRDPDWFDKIQKKSDWLSDAQALAIAEVPAIKNGGMCEKYTKDRLSQVYHVPFVMGNELGLDLNVMERGATALLNARLLPVIKEFMTAVKNALKKRNLNISEMIVRSDGSLMSDQVASAYPVQTILSGPASSVIGARNLAEYDNCLIVDMGGTTTDISLVKDNIPAMSNRICIGGYRTQIKGVYIDTFGLGGDSRITVTQDQLTLNTRRVQPLCVAAAEYPEIVPVLQKLVDTQRKHTLPLHEILYLVKIPENLQLYTKQERDLIQKLRNHPIMLGSGELDIYNLKTERLENEGILMRCGLTPTDIMHIKGDFSKYDKTASVLGATYVMHNLPEHEDYSLAAFCDDIYDLVCKKIYENLVKILFQNTYSDLFSQGMNQQLMTLISDSWYGKNKGSFFGFDLHTNVKLIGIGAPIHIFLPKVAEKLNTECIIPPHAEVANAVGAITADISAQSKIRISPNYTIDGNNNYTVYTSCGKENFKVLEDAVDYARKIAISEARLEARKRGALGELTVSENVDSNIAHDKFGADIELDTFVTATARGRVYDKMDT